MRGSHFLKLCLEIVFGFCFELFLGNFFVIFFGGILVGLVRMWCEWIGGGGLGV
jgi:hypothetical protein